MAKYIIVSVVSLFAGIIIGILIITSEALIPKPVHKQIIGFLPYWQIEQANQNEEKYITTLTYFGLNIDGSGHIIKLINDQQENPGWYELHSEKLGIILNHAKKNNIKLSLLISAGDTNTIDQLLSKPNENANTLIKEVIPLMKKYDFTDLNLDIEDSGNASFLTQKHFTQFVQAVKQQINDKKLGTLSLEVSTDDTIKKNLIDISAIEPYTDSIVLMAYDYHSPSSVVTGPVAPLNGAGINSEYDVTTAVEKLLQTVTPDKLILGMPLYGYEWETLNNAIRSASIPGSGILASNNRVESLLLTCASCSVFFDNVSKETFIVYRDESSSTYHQISVPNKNSVEAKLVFANKKNLNGVALWALGYEGNTILAPLEQYKQ